MQARLRADVLANRNNRAILARLDELALPDCWLVAGCLFQTAWNLQCGRAPEAGIKDYDLFYFDAGDLSEAGEQAVQARVGALFGDLGITVEAANQARVHLWYPACFGRAYPQLDSACAGIDRFLIPATCIGMSPTAVYAPNGLTMMYEGIMGMNPLTPYPELYQAKLASYRARWPWLREAPMAA